MAKEVKKPNTIKEVKKTKKEVDANVVEVETTKQMKVKDGVKLRLRASASLESNILEVMNPGQAINVYGEEGKYYKLRTANNSGFALKEYIEKV